MLSSLSRLILRIGLPPVFMLAIGCSGGDGDGVNYVPVIRAECSSTVLTDCGLNNKNVFIGVIPSLVLSCEDTLLGLNSSQRQALFILSGEATSLRAGVYLFAEIERWTNSTGGTQDTLDSGSYQVCAFIDSNDNGQYDITEPIGTGSFWAGQNFYLLNQWVAGN